MIKFFIIIIVGILVYSLVTIILMSSNSSSYVVKDRVKNLSRMNDLSDFSSKKKDKDSKGLFSFITVSNNFKAYMMSSGIKLKPEEYVVFWFVCTIFPMLLVLLIKGFGIVFILAGVLGALIPPFWVKISRKKRIEKFNAQLNDALIIIGNSLRSGFTFRHALARVAEDLPDPISEEFRRVIREVNYGANIEESLGQLAKKMQSKELEIINSAVVIQQRSGGNLAEIIDKVSETISDRIQMKNKIRALTAQGRMGGLVIAGIPIVLTGALMFINPEYIMVLFNTPIGLVFTVTGIALEIMGFYFINKLVDVKY